MSSPSISVMKLRQGVQFRLALAPVVICRPIARERLHRRELHALRCICDRFPFRPPGRRHTSAQINEQLFRSVESEGADCIAHRCGSFRLLGCAHGSSPFLPLLKSGTTVFAWGRPWPTSSLRRDGQPCLGFAANSPPQPPATGVSPRRPTLAVEHPPPAERHAGTAVQTRRSFPGSNAHANYFFERLRSTIYA